MKSKAKRCVLGSIFGLGGGRPKAAAKRRGRKGPPAKCDMC